MNSLKKVISLNQAAKISGYTQDYLGFLVRKGEIKGTKKGGTWFTTEEEVKNYLFKKKIRHQEFALREFFSPSRIKNIIVAGIIVFVGGFFLLSNFNKKPPLPVAEIHEGVTSDGEGIVINKVIK